MSVFLHGLGVKNFRGIDDEYQLAAGLSKFNFFIGPNNAGKSTMLDLAARYLPVRQRNRDNPVQSDPLDANRSSKSGPMWVTYGEPVDLVFRKMSELPRFKSTADAKLIDGAKMLLDWMAEDGLIWIEGQPPYQEAVRWKAWREADPSLIPAHYWQQLANAIGGGSGGNFLHWYSKITNGLVSLIPPDLPKVRLIPAFRRIGAADETASETSGSGLIESLARLQNPQLDRTEKDRKVFAKINRFLQTVTNRPEAKIEIPHSHDRIHVEMDGRILPLERLGTGIHQVVMLAAFCTVHDKQIICLEEPELHQHPLLQRRLVDYLDANTANQYLIATHSAAFIDTPGASVFHVWQEGGATRVKRAISKQDKFAICSDLGHRASDLLQTNAAVWVEGPSDRIYLSHWLRAAAPELEEGLHFTIMFYGGRLLSHLSANDEEVTDFIALRQLNRNLAIIIDSDKSRPHDKINPTKMRIVREFAENGGVAWVTQGREIENYVPHELLQMTVSQVHSDYDRPASGTRYDHALHYHRKPKPGRPSLVTKEIDKVKVARKVTETDADLTVLDLRKRILELANMIRRANGLPEGADVQSLRPAKGQEN